MNCQMDYCLSRSNYVESRSRDNVDTTRFQIQREDNMNLFDETNIV